MALKILALALLLALALSAPAEDEVLLAIPGYTAHKWYSGNSAPYARISQLHPRRLPLHFLRVAVRPR